MSKKFTSLVNINDVIRRAISHSGALSEREYAELLGISKENFSNRKRRETLLPLIIEWAVNERVDLQWLVIGERDSSRPLDPDPQISNLMEGARRVLTSGNPLAFHVLEQNIMYFDHAIEAEKQLNEMKSDVEIIKAELTRLKRENKRLDMEAEEQSSQKKVA